MKRALLLLAVILMVLFAFVGCNNNASSQASGATVADNKVGTTTSQGAAASKAKLSGQSGNAVNAAEEIEKILNGMDMKNDSPNIVVDDGSSSSAIDDSSKELNAILGNGSDDVSYK